VRPAIWLLSVLAMLASAPAYSQRIDIHLDSQPEISGGCPAHVHFRGEIKTFQPLHVTYQWLRSDGSHTEHSQTFGRPGPHPINTTWTVSGNHGGWVQLIILEPKRLQTIRSRFSVNCR
jgi:hypothetical protein